MMSVMSRLNRFVIKSVWCFKIHILFSDSVKSNILMGKPDATDEEVIAAAIAANAHDFIET